MTATPVTAERLSEIAALCEAATPGPWRQDCQIRVVAGPDSNPTDIIDYDHALHGEPPSASEIADLAFIAASRTAIPELLAEITRLRADLDHASTYSPFSPKPCPLCEYDDGRHTKPCAMHALIDEQSATIARMQGVIDSGNDAFSVARSGWNKQRAALETGLREACDQVGLVEPDFDLIDRLRALAGGGP